MTTKKLLLPILIFLVLFCLLFSFFGRSGYLVNRSLENYLDGLLQEEEEKKLSLASLEERKNSLSSLSALNDIALSLGYNNDGDVVYYFETPDEIERNSSVPEEDEDVLFEGLETWILALISLAATSLIMLCLAFARRRGGSDDAEKTGKYGGHYDEFDW